MLARLFVTLPFSIAMPKDLRVLITEYAVGGYLIRPLLPEFMADQEQPGKLVMNGREAALAKVLKIDFLKASFDRRRDTPLDPPWDLIMFAVSSVLLRLRYVTRDPGVKMPGEATSWHIEYSNDDETPLEEVAGHVRRLGGMQFGFSATGVDEDVWTGITQLWMNFEPPVWESLLIDARGHLPHGVGIAMVLGATALEVFIERILDQVAAHMQAPPKLWKWITERGKDLRLQPSVEEQFDVLLQYVTGHSLKEDKLLWDAFMLLKQVRNKFV